MKRAAKVLGLGVVALAYACGSPKPAQGPHASSAELAKGLRDALREEAIGDPAKATSAYLDLVAKSAAAPAEDGIRLAVLDASLDALAFRQVGAMASFSRDTALAFRTKNDALPKALEDARGGAHDAFAPGAIARALTHLAEHRGDAKDAAKWRAASGCATEATVIGPRTWTTVTGVREPDPLDAQGAKLEASYVTPGAFALRVAPVVERARGCQIALGGPSAVAGVRDVVVDVDVAHAGRIGVAMRAHSAAVLRVGGREVIVRLFELGGGDALQRAWVDVAGPGRLRLVARVGVGDPTEAVELDAWDDAGQPLAAHAPRPGEAASVAATGSGQVKTATPASADEAIAFVAGALATGDGRVAERALFGTGSRADAPPDVALLYGRALDTATDLSQVNRAERARAAYERVLEAWPAAWEAILSHAVLAGDRRGASEANLEALKDLDAHRPKATPAGAALLDAYDAAVSGREHLFDRAGAALARARAPLAGTTLLFDADAAAIDRQGQERVAHACGGDAARTHDDLDCYDALRATGDHTGAAREMDRLRQVRGAPNGWLAVDVRESLASGDQARAQAGFAAMTPAEQTLSLLFGVRRGDPPDALRKEVHDLAVVAKDGPGVFSALLRVLGSDPLAEYEGVAEKLVAEDRAKAILPDAATAIFAHQERYAVDPAGLVHATLFDVRRVTGTTDVDENAQADGPSLIGRASMRAVRRRIFKPDGRVLEPDRAPNAAQAHAELAQLESGDTVEAIYEGWMLPGETGDIGIDTPDLLPNRAAVREATVEIDLPAGLRGAFWSHPILGKPNDVTEAGTRKLVFTLKDHAARRLEIGVPRMDQSVGVSFATTSWGEVARALRETLAALDDHDPEIAAWARDAARGQAPGSKELVAAVVDAAGKAVRESDPMALSDFGLGRPLGGQQLTARTILTSHEGSRSWLIVRALRELGVPADIAVAEDGPFSADPSFPAHFGRFTHPLVVAHAKGGDVLIDADVAGPPLPAGRISPGLRGRMMVTEAGAIVPVPATDGGQDDRDEIDVRMAVDAKGDAKGSVTIVLRGRDAQDISEALFRIVGNERQRALREIVLAWVPFASVDAVTLSSSEGSWQVALRAELTASGYAQKQGAAPGQPALWTLPGMDPIHSLFSRSHVAELGATFAGQASRESALAISSSIQYHVHRRIELPKGAEVTRMPGPFALASSHLEAQRKLGADGQAVEDDFVLSLPTGTVPPGEYATFVDGAHKVDDAFLASTWIKPPT